VASVSPGGGYGGISVDVPSRLARFPDLKFRIKNTRPSIRSAKKESSIIKWTGLFMAFIVHLPGEQH
jgi:hypothetical protein